MTSYTYDSLYRLTGVTDGAGFEVGYTYDDAGNRTGLTYPDGRQISYAYDDGNRLQTVTDWHSGQFGYSYDEANRLTGLTLPDGIESYSYNKAGQLTLLAHSTLTDTLASYAYALDNVGNCTTLTEPLPAFEPPVVAGTYLETDGIVALEAENGLLSFIKTRREPCS